MLKRDDSKFSDLNEVLTKLANEIEESNKSLKGEGHDKNSYSCNGSEAKRVFQHVLKDPVKIRSKGAIRNAPQRCSICRYHYISFYSPLIIKVYMLISYLLTLQEHRPQPCKMSDERTSG